MRDKSTREVGDILENYVCAHLPHVRKTNNSGAVSGNGDMIDYKLKILIDCKNIPSKNSISISTKELDKIKQQSKNYNMDWILVHRNASGDVIVSMDFNLFLSCYDAMHNKDF